MKKDVLIGESVEYFCNMEMQNGIRYQKNKLDIVLEKPYGIAALMGPERILIYGRIVTI